MHIEAPPAVHPLIEQLFSRFHFAEVDGGTVDAFVRERGTSMLVFLEDPLRVRETLDLAVIVPQLAQAFPGRFQVGVVLPQAARLLQPRYGFRRYPAFVMLRDGGYLGTVEGLRNWEEYLAEVARLLELAPSRPPGIGINVQSAGSGTTCHS